MTHNSTVVKANQEVIGVDVQNKTGDNLGEITEIMLDKLTGRAAYIVLESGTFLGMGGKLLALPWNAISYDQNKDCFILDIDKERLKSAEGFDKDHWPDMADRTWGTNLNTFYKTKPYWE